MMCSSIHSFFDNQYFDSNLKTKVYSQVMKTWKSLIWADEPEENFIQEGAVAYEARNSNKTFIKTKFVHWSSDVARPLSHKAKTIYFFKVRPRPRPLFQDQDRFFKTINTWDLKKRSLTEKNQVSMPVLPSHARIMPVIEKKNCLLPVF